MKDEIEVDKLEEIHNGDVIIFTMDEEKHRYLIENERDFHEFLKGIANVFPNNLVIYLPRGMRISKLSEEDMNSLGWYKKEKDRYLSQQTH